VGVGCVCGDTHARHRTHLHASTDVPLVCVCVCVHVCTCARAQDARTPLSFAASKGHAGVVNLLLGANALVDKADKVGWVLCGAEGAPVGVRARVCVCLLYVYTCMRVRTSHSCTPCVCLRRLGARLSPLRGLSATPQWCACWRPQVHGAEPGGPPCAMGAQHSRCIH
jgi:hypothetical protein